MGLLQRFSESEIKMGLLQRNMQAFGQILFLVKVKTVRISIALVSTP